MPYDRYDSKSERWTRTEYASDNEEEEDDQDSDTDEDSDSPQFSGDEAPPRRRVKPVRPAKPRPFRFFDLPAELREQILGYLVQANRVIDIDYKSRWLVRYLHVSRQFHAEVLHALFHFNTFRVLPTHSNAVGRRAKPVLRRLSRRYRAMITSMELRLGPFWTGPPRCWKIDGALGLSDLTNLRRLDICVECDPSQASFKGFRRSEDYYTIFSSELLAQLLASLPALVEIRFDHYPSVLRDGPLMQRLWQQGLDRGCQLSWRYLEPEPGPEPAPAPMGLEMPEQRIWIAVGAA